MYQHLFRFTRYEEDPAEVEVTETFPIAGPVGQRAKRNHVAIGGIEWWQVLVGVMGLPCLAHDIEDVHPEKSCTRCCISFVSL